MGHIKTEAQPGNDCKQIIVPRGWNQEGKVKRENCGHTRGNRALVDLAGMDKLVKGRKSLRKLS